MKQTYHAASLDELIIVILIKVSVNLNLEFCFYR